MVAFAFCDFNHGIYSIYTKIFQTNVSEGQHDAEFSDLWAYDSRHMVAAELINQAQQTVENNVQIIYLNV